MSDARQQFAYDAFRLGTCIAGVQCGKFDGDARAFIHAASARSLANGVNGTFIVSIVTVGIRCSGRGLAEHIIAVAKALDLRASSPLKGLHDRLASDELFSHHSHRKIDAATDHRFTGPGHKARQHCAKPTIIKAAHESARNDQAPCGCIDEKRLFTAQVRAPIPAGYLVPDQRITSSMIRNTQKRFCQAHQRNSFLARKRIFLYQSLYTAASIVGAKGHNELTSRVFDGGALRLIQGRLLQ